jgi:uncharacterized protein YyaL (SSP411 family)
MDTNSGTAYLNRLAKESSPYLLQHANNPVDWYPWGSEALKRAESENKPILVSIGYSACHWCHVMEKESFIDESVAQIMNENFVCIKVDREERPDVDQLYITAVQLLAKNAGWPLNCFALPDGSPFYGGTYFPKHSWKQLLLQISDIYKKEKGKIEEQAKQIKQGLLLTDVVKLKNKKKIFEEPEVMECFRQMKKSFDPDNGGMTGAPKFPMPGTWLFLLRFSVFSGNKETMFQVEKTLDNIAAGGIYDHIGGGFARYSVDEKWFAPHFEKMLYDNAQLIGLYSEAFKVLEKERYKQVVYETIEFIQRELTSDEGLFYSSLDADSEGEEGKYYTWYWDEINDLLQEDSEIFCDYYNILQSGNWEFRKNILHNRNSLSTGPVGSEEKSIVLTHCKKLLLKEREKRIKPDRDDKIITSWNGLMIKALADAYIVFGEQDFLNLALRAGEGLLRKQNKTDGGIFRNYMQGKSHIDAFLDDYAFLIESFIALYKCTFDEKWINNAYQLSKYTLQYFYDKKSSMFYFTHVDKNDLVVRKMEISDHVIASSNSTMALNLLLLGKYFNNSEYLDIADQMLINVIDQMKQHPWYYANWLRLLTSRIYQNKEIAIIGKDAFKMKSALQASYIPDVVLAGCRSGSKMPLLKDRYVKNKTLIYLCENSMCDLPVETIEQIMQNMPELFPGHRQIMKS